jgi:eukaryotic-like serine/threonine-protein kinase
VVLLAINLVVAIVSAVVSLSGKGVLAAFEAGEAGLTRLESFDAAFAINGQVELLVYIAAAIAWLAWQSRTVENEVALGLGPSRYSPRWGMGWWFVPIANLVMPYLVHRDIHERYSGGTRSDRWLVMGWWLVFILGGITSNVVGRIWLAATTSEELQNGLTLWVLSDIIGVLSALLAILLVRRIQSLADGVAAARATKTDMSAVGDGGQVFGG